MPKGNPQAYQDSGLAAALQALGQMRGPGAFTEDIPLHANMFRNTSRDLYRLLGPATSPVMQSVGFGIEAADALTGLLGPLAKPLLGRKGVFDESDLAANLLGIRAGIEEAQRSKAAGSEQPQQPARREGVSPTRSQEGTSKGDPDALARELELRNKFFQALGGVPSQGGMPTSLPPWLVNGIGTGADAIFDMLGKLSGGLPERPISALGGGVEQALQLILQQLQNPTNN